MVARLIACRDQTTGSEERKAISGEPFRTQRSLRVGAVVVRVYRRKRRDPRERVPHEPVVVVRERHPGQSSSLGMYEPMTRPRSIPRAMPMPVLM